MGRFGCSVIGTVAESAGIRTGMRTLLVSAAVLLTAAFLNRGAERRIRSD